MTWQGIRASAPVAGIVNVPGSKSLSNRALVLAALSEGPSQISGLLLARDTRLMIAALQQLGIKIEVSGDHASITPNKLIGGGEINVGLAGTVMRFIPLVAALASGETTFVGDPEALKRPMQTTIESLRQLGISVSDSGSNTLPITVSGVGSVDGGELALDLSESSQFLSALLLVGARFKNGVKVTNTAKSVPSLPHIQMTIAMLAEHGVVVEQGENYWKVLPSNIRPINRVIEPDLSNATVFLAAAMLTKGSVTVAHWPAQSNQPSNQIQSLFLKLGARIELSDSGLTLHAPEKINPIDFDMSEIGEITPTIAAILSAASGTSRLTGIAHLRGHETNRLAALTSEFAKVGIRAKELPDGIEIKGGTLKAPSTELFSYHDHRMATFAALLGLLVDLKVNDIQTTEKTMPDFAIYWKQFVTGVA